MTPDQFTSFDESMPEKDKHIIVTNNINAKNAHGEMSHVWMTNFYTGGIDDDDGIVTFDARMAKIHRLTHWKYA